MVLINGVKYACERCIRGHRVTTCTHTDQPLMMIKPKGRPSTQCEFCKKQRKIRNAHTACNCSKKLNSKLQHDLNCPCHIDGHCTCCAKNKKSKKKEKELEKELELEKEKEKERGLNPPTLLSTLNTNSKTNSNSNSNISTPSATNSPILTTIKGKSKKLEKSKLTNSTISLTTTSDSESIIHFNNNNNNTDQDKDAQSNINIDLNLSSEPLKYDDSINLSNDLKFNDTESVNSILQSWDMSSPPMGNSESLASMLSDNSFTSNIKNSQRQIGLDPLQNFRSNSFLKNNQNKFQNNYQKIHQQPNINMKQQQQQQQQRGLGEISIPVDEYIKPLNKMNVHFNNFLNNLSDSSPVDASLASPNSISPGQLSGSDMNILNFTNINNNFNNNIDITTDSNNNVTNTTKNINNSGTGNGFSNTNNLYNSNSLHNNTNKLSSLYDVIPPTPGNGLLDIFEENAPTPKIYQNSTNTANSQLSNSHDNEPDSLFPLFPLIGPNYSQNQNYNSNANDNEINKLSQSNLNNFNMKPTLSNASIMAVNNSNSQQNLLQQAAINQASSLVSHQQAPLFHTATGSSTHSSNSYQSLHSNSHHSSYRSHNHQSHFQPYPSQPRRSNSFLSMSSSHTANSLVNSPAASFAERPQLLTVGSSDSIQAYAGPQLSNAKTNTTLMDDIYQTKTYTDDQSILTKRASISGSQNFQMNPSQSQQQQLQQQQQQQQQQLHYQLQPQSNDEQSEDYIENLGQYDPSMDMSLIGTVPMTSSIFMSNPGLDDHIEHKQHDSKNVVDQYDEQLFESLLQNDF